MKELFVPYQIAIDMKSIGFDEPCFSVYYNGEYHEHGIQNQFLHEKNDCSAPLYQQAFKFFREKYLLEGLILPQDKSALVPLPLYFIAIVSYREKIWNELFNSTDKNTLLHYSEYEEAQLGCLKKLIEIVKTN